MKKAVLVVVLFFSSKIFFGQTIARYGNHTISRNEFIKAYQKNNANSKATEKAYRDYLNLYIRYRLKVQAALDMKLDTLAGQKTELQNFENQIADQFTNDETSLKQMAAEAFVRSQHDLRISYIYVGVSKNAIPADTAKAWKKVQEAYQALKSGKDFSETAMQFSEDPFAKTNKGDIGYITVFDLPYAIETMAYQTLPGKYSPVFRTDGGYIILKKTAERPAAGRIRAAQILLIFPYQASEAAKTETHRRADSIYQAIRAGADFGAMAKKFSGDNLSYQLGGSLPEFGIGKYEAGFEETAFNLKKDGDISEPYASAFGYHIIKRVSRIPVPSKPDQKILDNLKEKIKADPRVAVSRKHMLQTILKQTRFREFVPAGNSLWEYTDSILANKKPAANAGINDQTILFQFPDKKYTVGDWMSYRKSLRTTPNLTNGKKNSEILDLYRQTVAFQYYKDHLEEYNIEYATQVKDFRDGNLLFEVMQQQIWNKASADSAGLQAYFAAHSSEYKWKPGADAIIFNVPNAASAKKLQDQLAGNMVSWRKITDSSGVGIQADSGRFELNQIPGHLQMEAGRFTAIQDNADKSVQFGYIIREYNGSAPRTFEEARGLAINDYQNELENKWIGELKKKYPVTIYEKVFITLPK